MGYSVLLSQLRNDDLRGRHLTTLQIHFILVSKSFHIFILNQAIDDKQITCLQLLISDSGKHVGFPINRFKRTRRTDLSAHVEYCISSVVRISFWRQMIKVLSL
jgi:hypothetical protein